MKSDVHASSPFSRLFSLLGAWALAFGCAVGWDAFVLPGSSFLPKAGPLGASLGVLLGGLIMAVVAWNYRFMICRRPGPGGVYSYATEAFGGDHGFICGWFLCLAYMAIVWMDATILVSVARHLFGHDLFSFGFRYTVSGNEVRFGHILLTALAIAAAAAVCCRRPFSRWMQTLLALVFAAGVGACFWAAWRQNGGGFAAMGPLFAEGEGHPVMQVLGVMAMAPWLFVGFEAVSNISGDFEFPAKWSFWPMAAALGTSVLAYAMLTAIPALAPPGGAADWAEGLAALGGAAYPAYEVASAPLGRAGLAVMAATMAGAIFTNLIGNTIAASRMLSAMADDGVVPRWFAHRNAEGASNHAIWAIAAMAVGISALGRTVVEIIVDIAVIGAGIAYAYTSAATFKLAGRTGDRLARATGMAGLVLSVALSLVFVWPTFAAETASMSTQSYLVVVMWCLAGMLCFLGVFLRDRERRFGHSVVVWPALLAMILLMSLMWIRQSTHETTARAYDDIIRQHAATCEHDNHSDVPADPHLWREILREKLHAVDRSIVGNSLVQLGLIVLSFALMFVLFASLRRRERDFEREKARAKSYFFSTVSHDIRTPLNAIIGFSEMLKNGLCDPEEREQAIESIAVSGKTLLALINDVLDLSKLESGKMDIVPEPTDCPKLLREVLDAFRVAGGTPGLELRCVVPPMPPLMLDPQRLRQIVFNIVGNAVKFTDRGHVELRAAWEPAPGGGDGTFRLDIEDTGCGIGEEDLKRIGSAYVQVAGPARNGGTGLGLAICRQLAAAMGGRLDIVSRLGKGSTFSLVVPGVRPAPEGATDAEPAALKPPVSGDRPAHPVRRVLLVDDSKINLMVLRAFLKHLGNFDIAVAMDGQQALDILRKPGAAPFDLVLTDMWMPVLDGEGLIRAIRADPALASLRVVSVTADVEVKNQAADLGFDAILLKPVTADKLSQILSPA